MKESTHASCYEWAKETLNEASMPDNAKPKNHANDERNEEEMDLSEF